MLYNVYFNNINKTFCDEKLEPVTLPNPILSNAEDHTLQIHIMNGRNADGSPIWLSFFSGSMYPIVDFKILYDTTTLLQSDERSMGDGANYRPMLLHLALNNEAINQLLMTKKILDVSFQLKLTSDMGQGIDLEMSFSGKITNDTGIIPPIAQIMFNIATNRLEVMNAENRPIKAVQNPKFFYMSKVIYELSIINGFAPDGSLRFISIDKTKQQILAVDTDYDHATVPAVEAIYTPDETNNPFILRFDCDCTSEAFLNSIKNKQQQNATCEITAQTIELGEVVFDFPVILKNRIYVGSEDPTPPIDPPIDPPTEPDGALTDENGNILTDDAGNTLINL